VDPEVRAFAESFRRFVERMTERTYSEDGPSAVRARLDAHLGTDSATLPVVAEEFPAYDRVNVQVGLDAYLGAEGRTAQLLGIAGPALRAEEATDARAASPGEAPPVGDQRITVTDEDVHAALDELLEAGNVLTRVLLAGRRAGPPGPTEAPETARAGRASRRAGSRRTAPPPGGAPSRARGPARGGRRTAGPRARGRWARPGSPG